MTLSRRSRHFGRPLIGNAIVAENGGSYTAWRGDGSIVECATIEAAAAAIGGQRYRFIGNELAGGALSPSPRTPRTGASRMCSNANVRNISMSSVTPATASSYALTEADRALLAQRDAYDDVPSRGPVLSNIIQPSGREMYSGSPKYIPDARPGLIALRYSADEASAVTSIACIPFAAQTRFNLETAVGRCEVHSVSEISRLGCIRLGRGGAGRGGGVR